MDSRSDIAHNMAELCAWWLAGRKARACGEKPESAGPRRVRSRGMGLAGG